MLRSSETALGDAYDLAMLDLDGVVYVGPEPVPNAPQYLQAARARGIRLAFITNNAVRPPEEVAAHLRDLGVAATTEDVVTSAQAAARVLVERLLVDGRGTSAHVALLGGPGLDAALRAENLVPVGLDGGADSAEAIVSGYGPDVLWRDVMRAAVRIRDGWWWVASNADLTIPTSYGVAPGHGVLVETLRRFSGVEPVVAGKPARPLFDETLRRVGGERPLMVGDRLDTDIAGANAAGIDALLVLTGVTTLEVLVAAEPHERPTYLAPDLRGLLTAHSPPEHDASGSRCGGWRAWIEDGLVRVSGDGETGDWWRAVAEAAWRHADQVGETVVISGLTPPEPPTAATRG